MIEMIVKLKELSGDRIPAVSLCGPARTRQLVSADCLVGKDRPHGAGKSLSIGFRQPGIRLVGVRKHSAGAWRNKRQPGSHRFEWRNPERLSRVGVDEDIAIGVKINERCAIRDMPERADQSWHFLSRFVFELIGKRPRSGDKQSVIRISITG